MMRAMWVALAVAAMSVPAAAAERRCGWLQNPSPANWFLVDRDGSWELWTQGRPMPPGLLPVTGMTDRDWVRPQGGPYGYGCACLTVEADPTQRVVTRVTAAQQLPVARCRADRALPPPG